MNKNPKITDEQHITNQLAIDNPTTPLKSSEKDILDKGDRVAVVIVGILVLFITIVYIITSSSICEDAQQRAINICMKSGGGIEDIEVVEYNCKDDGRVYVTCIDKLNNETWATRG